MKLKIEYTWYRSMYNKDNVLNWAIIDVDEETKKGVTQAIRKWAGEWTGSGHIIIHDVYNTTGELKECCNIKQRKFNFNN